MATRLTTDNYGKRKDFKPWSELNLKQKKERLRDRRRKRDWKAIWAKRRYQQFAECQQILVQLERLITVKTKGQYHGYKITRNHYSKLKATLG